MNKSLLMTDIYASSPNGRQITFPVSVAARDRRLPRWQMPGAFLEPRHLFNEPPGGGRFKLIETLNWAVSRGH